MMEQSSLVFMRERLKMKDISLKVTFVLTDFHIYSALCLLIQDKIKKSSCFSIALHSEM